MLWFDNHESLQIWLPCWQRPCSSRQGSKTLSSPFSHPHERGYSFLSLQTFAMSSSTSSHLSPRPGYFHPFWFFLPTVTVGAAPQWSAIKTKTFGFWSMYVVKGDCSAPVQQIWQGEIPFFGHSSQYCISGHNNFNSWALYMLWDLLFLLVLLGMCCLCFCFLSSLSTWFLILFLFPCLL